MSGEARIVRGALTWGALATPPVAGLAFLVRGAGGALSVAVASAIVLANAGLAAGASALAGRASTMSAAMVALPSFAVRMIAIVLVLGWLQTVPSIDRPVFAFAFAAWVTAVLALEARGWKRTPWLVTTFGPTNPKETT